MSRLTTLVRLAFVSVFSMTLVAGVSGCSTSSAAKTGCVDATQASGAVYTDATWKHGEIRYVLFGSFQCDSDVTLEVSVELPRTESFVLQEIVATMGPKQVEFTMADTITNLMRQTKAESVTVLDGKNNRISANQAFQVYAALEATKLLKVYGVERIGLSVQMKNQNGEMIESFRTFADVGSSTNQ